MDEVFDPASRRRRQSQGMGAEEPEVSAAAFLCLSLPPHREAQATSCRTLGMSPGHWAGWEVWGVGAYARTLTHKGCDNSGLPLYMREWSDSADAWCVMNQRVCCAWGRSNTEGLRKAG